MTGIITQPRTLEQCVVGGGGAVLPAPKFGNCTSTGEIEDTKKDQVTCTGPPGRPPPGSAGLPDHPQVHMHWAQTRSVGVASVPKRLEK